MAVKQRREREIENLRRAILDAARELFALEDYRAVSLRKIAEKIEYSPAAIYRYFKDKEEILFHLIDEGFQMLTARLRESANASDPVERLRLGARAYVDFGLTQPHYYRLMFQLEKTEMMEKYMPECQSAHSAFGYVTQAAADAISQGAFVDDRPAIVIAASLWAGMHGVVSLCLSGHLHVMMAAEHNDPLIESILEGVIRLNLKPS